MRLDLHAVGTAGFDASGPLAPRVQGHQFFPGVELRFGDDVTLGFSGGAEFELSD